MSIFFKHSALVPSGAKRTVAVISFLRALFFAIVIVSTATLIDLGTSAVALILAATCGVVFAAAIAFSALRWPVFFVSIAAVFGLYQLLFGVLGAIPSEQTFWAYSLLQHTNLLFIVFSICAFSTWMFWRYASSCSVELLALASGCIYLLSGHRQFRFDTPALVSQLAWFFGLEHLSMLIALGVALLLCCLAYLYFSTLPSRPLARVSSFVVLQHPRGSSLIQRLLAITVFGLLVAVVSMRVYTHYRVISLSVTANGVGETSQVGLSPLGFHSALGSTNQPSALVRLDGDYSANPFSPMLYLRESALSEFNGHEMVLADPSYDQDITRTRPEESFTGKEDVELDQRSPLIQSAFLLTEHDNAFAVDYPLSITRLKNPNRNRFKGSFRSYSMVPAFPKELMDQGTVGDPRWDQKTREHYLKPHSDPRYADLARKLTSGFGNPITQIQAIVSYMNKNATYTLAPNHDVAPDQDPVAPFLFGDMRGYCVHFAHATVFLARALGIPSRIGTGYLTDLSQAKDGHILLRMSDRHAWAEVYIKGLGWLPFDTQPEKVESHAESPVDLKLLEELMGLVGPGEEILPADIGKDEPGLKQSEPFKLPQSGDLIGLLAGVAALLLIFKIYLRFAWILPGSNTTRLKRAYRAMAASLVDIGIHRAPAETRFEFMQRARDAVKLPVLECTQLLSASTYAEKEPLADKLQAVVRSDLKQLSSMPWPKKILAAINPNSVFRFMLRGRW